GRYRTRGAHDLGGIATALSRLPGTVDPGLALAAGARNARPDQGSVALGAIAGRRTGLLRGEIRRVDPARTRTERLQSRGLPGARARGPRRARHRVAIGAAVDRRGAGDRDLTPPPAARSYHWRMPEPGYSARSARERCAQRPER